MNACTSEETDISDVIEPAALELIAARLKTPLQIEQHLTLAFEAVYQAGEKPVSATVVESVLSKQLDDLVAEDFYPAFREIILAVKNEDADWEEIREFPKYNFAEVMLGQIEFARNTAKGEKERAKELKNFRDAFSKVVTLICKKFTEKGVDNRYYLVRPATGRRAANLQSSRKRLKLTNLKTSDFSNLTGRIEIRRQCENVVFKLVISSSDNGLISEFGRTSEKKTP